MQRMRGSSCQTRRVARVFHHAHAARQLGLIQCSAFAYKNLHPPASSTKTRAASAMLYSRLPRAHDQLIVKTKMFASQPHRVESRPAGLRMETKIQITCAADALHEHHLLVRLDQRRLPRSPCSARSRPTPRRATSRQKVRAGPRASSAHPPTHPRNLPPRPAHPPRRPPRPRPPRARQAGPRTCPP